MTTCWACESELRPEWKFCIQCGVPVEKDAEVLSEQKPASPLALFGWIFAAIGFAVVITGAIIFAVSQ